MKKILLFLFILPYLGYTQTLGSDKIISSNANNSSAKNVLIDSITAYDARNLGNQAIIGSLTDTILVTNAGVIKKLVGDAKINGVRVGTGGGNIASNTVVGNNAGYSNTTGYNNSFSGYAAGSYNSTGYNNSFLGYYAGYFNSTGYSNSFIGYQAGYNNSTGNGNSFIGYQAGYNNLTGNSNSFLGYSAGNSNTIGNYNSFIGYQAGYYNTTGSGNSFSGYAAGYYNSTGYNNFFLGYVAGYFNTTGYNNSFLGVQAGYYNTSGYQNAFLGFQAGLSNTIGSNNLYLGNQAGKLNISGSSNTYLGVQSTGVTNGSSRSNMLAIGTYSNGTYIFGDSTGAIGIGTTTPAYKLDVSGTARISSLGTGASTDLIVSDSAGILRHLPVSQITNTIFVDTLITTSSNLSLTKYGTTINNGATAVTLTIPTGLPAGYSYKLKISDSSTGVITIASSENVYKSTLSSTTITNGSGGIYDLIKNGLGFWNLQ